MTRGSQRLSGSRSHKQLLQFLERSDVISTVIADHRMASAALHAVVLEPALVSHRASHRAVGSHPMSVPQQFSWGSKDTPLSPSFLETIAGQAGLSQAVSARSIPIFPPIEIEINEFVFQSVDLLDPTVLSHIKFLIKEGWLLGIHFGTPCSSYSRARKNDGGPPPLRSASSLWGLTGLKDKDREKVLSWATSS